MNRKSNPWLSLIALVLLAVILVCICTGCTPRAAAATDEAPRFTIEFAEFESHFVAECAAIITDTTTGEQYLWVTTGQSGGLTHLETAKGD